jgi:NADH-quinone oxidoreductase subunit F
VLEGILLASYATRASTSYLYLRYEYGHAYRTLQKAIDELYANNLLGRNILGKEFSLDVSLHRGAGAYICGEETGLIESLEGKRGWPRIKPPFPAIEGAFRKPTVVNNIETLACVTHIVDRGADWFKSMGVPPDPKNPRDAGSYGPKLYCISGHVNKPCCVELPLGITVRDLVDKYGGGVWKGRKAKGCIPGGISMGIMTEKEFDTPLDFAGPGRVGCLGLGTAAVTIFDEQTSIVDIVYNICRFFEHESCGQCTPCREGTGWMLKITDRIRHGKGRIEDLQILDEVGKGMGIMPGTTICGLADGAGWPVKNAVAKFRGELEEYIRSGQRTREPVLAHV